MTVSAAAVAACSGAAAYGTFLPGRSFWGRVIRKGPASRQVALTFDDGPTPGGTDRVLDRLAELGAPATFFVIGRHAASHPDLIRRMDAEGHIVGNHSYDHDHYGMFGGLRYWAAQIRRTDDCVAEIIGRRPAIFRPPMGFMTWPIHHCARAAGHRVVAWSRRGRDGIRGDTQTILRRLKPREGRGAGGGDIQLLHDGIDPHLRAPVDRSATAEAIAPLVAAIRGAGLELVSLGRMLGIQAYQGEQSMAILQKSVVK